MATEPRGRFRGSCQTDSGRGLWAERRAVVAPPDGVVEEAGWARVGGGGWGW
jgi:hypothetical protein